MIVAGWHDLTHAIDEAVPCYSPIPAGPYGADQRCGACQGCKDYDAVVVALAVVESNIEAEFDRLAEAAT